MHTVEHFLKAGEAAQRKRPRPLLPLEFNHLVRECLDLARSRHHLQTDALDYRESLNGAGSAEVAGDPEELRTAGSNLLDNAVKYSPGGVRISVELEVPDAGHVGLRVRDNG